jgi:tRNA (adenine22-N1)-methyltransferase
MYRDGSSIWDIGCDHGLLGMSFLEADSVKEIHLVDPSDSVVKKLNETYTAYITEQSKKIQIQKQFGQELKLSGTTKCLFIAGMGGKEIVSILAALKPQLNVHDQVVISPHRSVLELRQDLKQLGFRLYEEQVIEEVSHFYEIMSLGLNPELPSISDFGEKLWLNSTGQRYRLYLIEKLTKHQDLMSSRFVEWLRNYAIWP